MMSRKLFTAVATLLVLAPATVLGQVGTDPTAGTISGPSDDSTVATGGAVVGTVTVVEVPGPNGVTERDERVQVTLPMNDGVVRYTFTNRGGTVRNAHMLHPRYTRDELLPELTGLPADKAATGPIDLVTSWDPKFLPFRIVFRELSYAGQVVRVRRKTTQGRVSDGRIEAATAGTLDIDRPVLVGDLVTVTAPEALKGTFNVTKVHESGTVNVEPPLASGSFDKVAYTVSRKGDLKELFEKEPTFVRIGPDPNAPPSGLPLRYVWPDPNTDTSDIFIEKVWEAGTQPYELSLKIVIHNLGKQDLKEGLGIRVAGWQHPGLGSGSAFQQPTDLLAASCYTDDTLERFLMPELVEEQHEERAGAPLAFQNRTTWVGLDTTYFLSAVIPRSMPNAQCQLEGYPNGVIASTLWSSSVAQLRGPEYTCTTDWMPARQGTPRCADLAAQIGASEDLSNNKMKAAWIRAKANLSGDALSKLNKAWDGLRGRQRNIYRFSVYTGPKDQDILKGFDAATADAATGEEKSHLIEAMDYGMLGFIAEPMHALLKWFHSWANHWGLAIILLTLLVKLVLLPVTNKGFQNMQMMKKLQPDITAIKEKHKGGDQSKMNQDMMALYKRHGFNPLMGCLPMLAQMPIWFALYQTIGSAVELYHAPLGLWIQDLSAGDPYYVMPVALAVLMLAQSALTTSTGGDALQQKLMKYGLPLMFGVFMLFLPSGLVLYILVNTLLTIVQNLVIRKRMGITA